MSDAPAIPLEERDAERQLRDINEALLVSSVRQHELTEQAQKAEAALRASEERLAAELTATLRLQAVSTQMISEGDVEALYDQILDAAVAIMRSDMASMQIVDEGQDELRMLSWRGFDPAFAEIFELVRPDTNTSCSVARQVGRRVVVPDVEICDFIVGTSALKDHRKTGIRAVQSTPLFSRSNKLLGMISTHWREPHHPSERDLRFLDLLARQAADLIERKQAEEARERVHLEAERRQTLFNSILSSVHDFVYVFDREQRFTYANRVLLELWGLSAEQALGKTMAELNYPKDTEEQLLRDVRKVVATGQVVKSVTQYSTPVGASGFYENVLAPVPSVDGRVELIVGISRDITERRQAEDTQRLLLGELNHRVRNTLATIQAIAHQTLGRTHSPQQFVANFSGRIQALARVHTLLTRTTWQGADLREVIHDQVLQGPIDETRLAASGPSVMLNPQTALHLALVLHELGTNSCKYGALSAARGRVTVNWTVQAGELRLQWVERGGPMVSAPAAQGFGTKLIEQSVKAHQGEARMLCEAQGVTWGITLLLPRVSADVSASSRPAAALTTAVFSGAQPGPVAKDTKRGDLAGKRVLVVEDEPLVALDIMEVLDAVGIKGIGPIGSVEEAQRLIETERLDTALVDANLRGRPVDAIAAALTRRGVPFAFVTGYDRNALPQAFRGTAMLAKPYTHAALVETIEKLLSPRERSSRVTPLRGSRD